MTPDDYGDDFRHPLWWRIVRSAVVSLVAVALVALVAYVSASVAVAGTVRTVTIEVPASSTAPAVRESAEPLRVALVGDSTSRTSADAWARLPGVAVVVADGRDACAFIRPSTGWSILSTMWHAGECDWTGRTYPDADVVIASWGVFIAADYTDGDAIDWVRPSGPLVEITKREMEAFEAQVAPVPVLWVTYPATAYPGAGWERLNDSARNAAMWPMLLDMSSPCTADLAAWVDAHVAGDPYADDIHLAEPVQDAAAAWLADRARECVAASPADVG